MIVRNNPSMDIPHPIRVTTERASGFAFSCDTSNNKAKLVK